MLVLNSHHVLYSYLVVYLVDDELSFCFYVLLMIVLIANDAYLTNAHCEQDPRFVDPLNITAMACPALPLCPLAITEAERGIPDILKRVRSVFDKVF